MSHSSYHVSQQDSQQLYASGPAPSQLTTSAESFERLKTLMTSLKTETGTGTEKGSCIFLTPLAQTPEEVTLLHYAFAIYKDLYVNQIRLCLSHKLKNVKNLIHDISKFLMANEVKSDAEKIAGVIGQINQYYASQTDGTQTIELLSHAASDYMGLFEKVVSDKIMPFPRQEFVLEQTFKRIHESLGPGIEIMEDEFIEYINRVLRILLPQILDELKAEQTKNRFECKLFCKELLQIAMNPMTDNKKQILSDINHFLIDRL